ncbi:hypothetical protein [Lysobacter sp. GCM10012299]|uniref:hypothetical protein n=1 Tax=Lysobacter sp. GCM10012299 TaxID=3317333 RepID=UPI003618F268
MIEILELLFDGREVSVHRMAVTPRTFTSFVEEWGNPSKIYGRFAFPCINGCDPVVTATPGSPSSTMGPRDFVSKLAPDSLRSRNEVSPMPGQAPYHRNLLKQMLNQAGLSKKDFFKILTSVYGWPRAPARPEPAV